MDPSPHKPFDEEARQHGFDPDWLLAYAREHLATPPTDVATPVDHETVIKPLLDKLNQHPISAIWVANFKSFGAKPQRFPLAPVTLVFGPNSAGKSSLMQALLYAQHAILENEFDVSVLRGAGNLVDLGGFDKFVHGNAEPKVVSLIFILSHHWLKEGPDSKRAGWHVDIGRKQQEAGNALGYQATLVRAILVVDNKPAVAIINGVLQIDLSHRFFYDLMLQYVASKEAEKYFPDSASTDDEKLKIALEGLENHLGMGDFRITGRGIADYRCSFSPPDGHMNLLFYSMDGSFMSFMDQIVERVNDSLGVVRQSIDSAINTISYLGSQRTLPGRDYENISTRDRNYKHNGGASWDLLRSAEGKAIRTRLNDWFADLAKREDRKGLAQYRFDTSYDLNRNLVEEIIETETENFISSFTSKIVIDALGSEQTHSEAIQKILSDIEGTELLASIREAIEAKDGATTNHRLQIVDARVGRPVTPADIGVGIQYLIPVLVEILGDHTGTKIIEEPELHAHPALQAELGDALIEGALRESSPGRFIVETHSEHLILRILRRIREASEGSNKYPAKLPKVRPEDVAVIYAEPSSEGTILHHLKITDDGDFIDRWPAGFFTERADELF